jgi:ABC-type iron transport system FetAB permease component
VLLIVGFSLDFCSNHVINLDVLVILWVLSGVIFFILTCIDPFSKLEKSLKYSKYIFLIFSIVFLLAIILIPKTSGSC